jgi:hypothetical protein
LIQEILDFKSWVVGCLKDGLETLVGHTNMHIFKFFADSMGWPVMQYNVSPTNLVRSPADVPPIRLWKTNPDGSPMLPTSMLSLIIYCPIWGIDPSKFVERQKFISASLPKYVDFWKVGIARNVTYEMKMAPYVEYWEDILLHLSRPSPCQSAILLEGLWPLSNWKFNYSKASLLTAIDGGDP